MSKHLIRAEEYCIISFVSTHHALASEKILKNSGLSFILIPTPREISTSCGLSVKLSCSDKENALKTLAQQHITQVEVYRIYKESGHHKIVKI